MTLRIETHTGETVTTLKIEGVLTTKNVSELDSASRSVDGRIGLDLSDLRAADAEGVQSLKNLLAKGALLLGASPYIAVLLKRENR